MVDPISTLKSIYGGLQKIYNFVDGIKTFDKKASFTAENLKTKISTFKSFQSGLTDLIYDNISQEDQENWEKRRKHLETCTNNTTDWMKNRNKPFWNRFRIQKQNDDLDDLMKKLESALDDFEKFLKNTLKIQKHKINQENNQYHRTTAEGVGELVEHFTGQ
ncbi:unnamed protein product, partial [Rotaria socialis]